MRTILWAGTAGILVLGLAGGCIINSKDGSGGSGSGTQSTTASYSATTSYTTASTGPTTGPGMVTTCDPVQGDDGCVSCEKSSCCNEIMACDNDVACSGQAGLYQQWYDCLFPDGQNSSGYTGSYCEAAVKANGTATGALIECISSKCSAATACGSDAVTWDNFAAKFTEDFCAGCHFPGFGGDVNGVFKSVPQDLPQLTDDANWSYWPCPDPDPNNCATMTGPEFNPDWKTPGLGVSYDETVQAMATAMFPTNDRMPDKIWCGVSTQLPTECAMDFPGKFPNPKRFPPAGTDPMRPDCSWTEGTPSNGACPQPTDEDRNRMASWIFDGMAK